jgi:hypothetical protein
VPKSLFVHIDTTSNAILSQGLTQADFFEGIVHQPKNILLLDPSLEAGEYEAHTGMRIIRGTDAIQAFFEGKRPNSSSPSKWIDFSDLAIVKELSPMEISELLYFGHMQTHLHSPFFYKLQNNFVYFPLNNNATRVYYRYLDEFYRILSGKITRIVLEKVGDRRGFFRKAANVKRIESELLKNMKPLLQEGIIFDFKQSLNPKKEYKIDLYLAEDQIRNGKHLAVKKEDVLGELTYSTTQQIWTLDVDNNDLSF